MNQMAKQRPSKILVVGSVNVDLVLRLPQLPRPGETVLGGTFLQAAGGKGGNQAVAAARAGGQVKFLAAVGADDYGWQALDGYEREGIDCQHFFPIESAATGIATILVDAQGENMIGVASGANALLAPQHVDRLSEETFAATAVLLASLEIPLETVAQALKRARCMHVRTILNPAPALEAAGEPGLLELVDILTPNEGEAARLTGRSEPPHHPSDRLEFAEGAARELRRRGAREVVVTLGELGCLVVAEQTTHLPAVAVTPVDATAAGDAFNGALAVALAEGKSLVDAARWANRAAGLATTVAGAQPSLPSRAEIDRLADTP